MGVGGKAFVHSYVNASFLFWAAEFLGPDVQLVRRMLVLELKNQEVMVDEISCFLDYIGSAARSLSCSLGGFQDGVDAWNYSYET